MRHLLPARLLFCAFFAVTLHAQTHRVEAPEKVTRSIAVWEWTGDLAKPTAARLVPVSVFIEGQFQDGGTYYSRPIPLALLNGNIYSLEKAGIPQGTITLDYARHLQPATSGAEDSTNLGWFGYGTYATMPAERKSRPLQASVNLPVISSSKDDDRPTFVRRNSDESKTAGAPDDTKDTKIDAKNKKNPTVNASVTPAPATPDDDPDRPHFSKPPITPATPPDPSDPSAKPADTSAKPSNTSTKQTSTSTDPADDNDRPTLRHRDPKQAESDRKARARGSVTATPGSLNDDPDRPNMRRGKTAGIGGDPAPQLLGTPAGLHQIVAVSDPTTRPPHPFAREWATPTERTEVLAKLQSIAQQQLADYAKSNGSTPSSPPAPAPKPGTSASARARARRAAAKPAPAPSTAPLSDEQITAYTLSYGGLPTFVYTATSPSATGPERYLTIVAQQLPSGEMQRAFASVTDAAHLDRTPWFRLIDAVDPDAEHRASLLFELRGHSQRQFTLYRILSARAEPIFTTSPTD